MAVSISTTHGFMLSSSSALLCNQKLCAFLEKMDAEENSKLTEEEGGVERELSTLDQQYSWGNILYEGGRAALVVGGLTGFGKYVYDHSPLATIKTDENALQIASLYRTCMDPISMPREQKQAAHLAFENRWRQVDIENENARLADSPKESAKWFAIVAVSVGCIAVGYQLSTYKNKKNHLLEGATNSINNARYERILKKIRDIEQRLQASQERLELEQLPIAKEFFGLKHLEIKAIIQNTITVVHRYV